MRILLYNGKLVKEVGYVSGEKVVLLRYVDPDDMPKCTCGKPIDQEISIIEGCRNWKSDIKGVETLTNN